MFLKLSEVNYTDNNELYMYHFKKKAFAHNACLKKERQLILKLL